MDLILWRHAEAEEAAPDGDDLRRALTHRGERQAARVAAWLDTVLPEGARILSSPALRCEQTVIALGRKYKLRQELAPDTSPAAILEAARWPDAKQAVLVVGHQPVLGQAIASLLQMQAGGCPMRKGSVWWLRNRQREGDPQTMVVAVRSPDEI